MASEQFSLCWDNFHKNMSSGMNALLENEDLVDVTLAVQGKCLKAHKMVLSVCSPYFKELFKSNPCQHPIVFMKDVSYEALSDLLQFMYQGEVQVSQENLTTFIKTAEALQIKGLTGDGNGSADNDVTEVIPEKHTPHVEEYKPIVHTPRPKKQQPAPPHMSSPSVKRQRLSVSSNESQPLPPAITKVEPVAPPPPINVPPEPAPVQFKMEPYDQTHNLLDETGDDNFGDDTLDETVGDDTEDYSMMESGGGEEEPQAGTSADGAGEGQDLIYRTCTNPPIIIHDGHFFSLEKATQWAYLKIFWSCMKKRSTGCKFRFRLIENKLEIMKKLKHNHSPSCYGDLDQCGVEIVKVQYVTRYSKLKLYLNPEKNLLSFREMIPKFTTSAPGNKDLLSYLNLQEGTTNQLPFNNILDEKVGNHDEHSIFNNSFIPQDKVELKDNQKSIVKDDVSKESNDAESNKNVNGTHSIVENNIKVNLIDEDKIKQEVLDVSDIEIKSEPEDFEYAFGCSFKL